MKKLILGLAAILLLTLPISAARATQPMGAPTHGSGTRSPLLCFPPACGVESRVVEGYQIIHSFFNVDWIGAMEGKSVLDQTIIESPDRRRLTFHGIDTFKGKVGDRNGTASFSVTGTILLTGVGEAGNVEGRFVFLRGTGGLRHLAAQGVFQRQHDQPKGAYSIIFHFDDDDGDDDD
jgi:hypothetical protein